LIAAAHLAAVLLLVNSIMPAACRGDPGEHENRPLEAKYVSTGYFTGGFISGFTSRKAVVPLLVGGALSLALSELDDEAMISRSLEDEEFPMEGSMDVGNVYGNGALLAAGSLALAFAGHVGGRSELTAAGNDMMRSLLLGGALTWTVKIAVDRRRPGGGGYSFPSGHTAAAFSVAPVISHYFGPWLGIPAYAMATFTALGRMEDRRHYLTDVIFGAAVGIAAGEAVVSVRNPPFLGDRIFLTPFGVTFFESF